MLSQKQHLRVLLKSDFKKIISGEVSSDGYKTHRLSRVSSVMKIIIGSIIASLVIWNGLKAQQITEEDYSKRSQKIEDIFRIQDTRTPHNGKLLQYLTDGDSVVRKKATFALGSYLDTTMLPLLINNLSDENEDVRIMAAFAIGQTAPLLSKPAVGAFERDLIINRLDQIQAKSKRTADRLIEEIGKFGTEDGLKELMLRFGSDQSLVNMPLVMSIARFAIRNIKNHEATLYLFSLANRNENLPWQVMYALQRIGATDDVKQNIGQLISHYKQNDPVVRMHLATLLGKVKDAPSSIEPLMQMAEYDSDWRVRVNAIKSLGNFPILERYDVIDLFRRLFFDKTEYVGLVALEILGGTDLKEQGGVKSVAEVFSTLRKITENVDDGYLKYYQIAAANTLARLTKKDAVKYIHVNASQDKLVQNSLLHALGNTGDISIAPVLDTYLESDQLLVVRAAIEALDNLTHANPGDSVRVESTYNTCLRFLNSDDVALATTVAEILRDSIFLRASTVQPMIERLERCHIPYDIELMQSICATLAELQDQRAVKILEHTLESPDRSVAQSAASALERLTGKDYGKKLPEWFQPLYTDFDFGYLNALPNIIGVTMETTRGTIRMELYKDVAPFTVMSFLKLASQRGFFRGLTFHRIVPNFVIQGGDPRGDGWGGPGYSIRSEFSMLSYETGTLGMASAGRDTEGSQFFITTSPQPHLDGKYTIFGKVVSGMDIVNAMRVDDTILDVKVGK